MIKKFLYYLLITSFSLNLRFIFIIYIFQIDFYISILNKTYLLKYFF